MYFFISVHFNSSANKTLKQSRHLNIELTVKTKESFNEFLDYQFQLNLNRQMIKHFKNLLNINNGIGSNSSIN